MRTVAFIVMFILGLWCVSKGWGILGIVLGVGCLKLASSDRWGSIEDNIGAFVFIIICAGICLAAVRYVIGLLGF